MSNRSFLIKTNIVLTLFFIALSLVVGIGDGKSIEKICNELLSTIVWVWPLITLSVVFFSLYIDLISSDGKYRIAIGKKLALLRKYLKPLITDTSKQGARPSGKE